MNGPITQSETHLGCRVFCDDCGVYIKTIQHKVGDVAKTVMGAKLANCQWWCRSCWEKKS